MAVNGIELELPGKLSIQAAGALFRFFLIGLFPILGFMTGLCCVNAAPANLAEKGDGTSNPIQEGPLLSKAKAVRELSVEEADRGYPVRLRGVVTFSGPEWSYFFLQDDSSGIYISTGPDRIDLEVGSEVEVAGTAFSGGYAPSVESSTVRVLGTTQMPVPVKVGIAQLLSGRFDCQWIETTGVVRTAGRDADGFQLSIWDKGSRINVRVGEVEDVTLLAELVDASVVIRGVCSTRFDERGRLEGFRVITPTLGNVSVEKPPPLDPFLLPMQSLGHLLPFTPEESSRHRIRVGGIVTFQRVGELLFITDSTNAVCVRTAEPIEVQPGDHVEVVGFPEMGACAPELRDASFRRMGGGEVAVPVSLGAQEAFSRVYHGHLIEVEGVLMDRTIRPGEQVLVLQSEGYTFPALLDSGKAGNVWESLRNGSLVRVTGVCLVEVDSNQNLRSIQILLRSPNDVMALRQSERNLRTIFEESPIGIATIDPQKRVLTVNRSFCEMMGCESEELVGRAFRDLTASNDLAGNGDLLGDLFAEKIAVLRAEQMFKNKAGDNFWVHLTAVLVRNEDGSVSYALGMLENISGRKQVEASLQQFELRFRKAFRASPVSVAVSTLGDGKIVDVNDAFLRLFGFRRDEVVGRHATELGIWADSEERVELIRDLQRHRSLRDVECQLVSKEGKHLQALISVEMIDFDGEPCSLMITHDLTERFRLEALLRQSQKMEAAGQLAAGLAHDFNNIMTIIQLHTSLLLTSPETSDKDKSSLTTVLEASERAAKLTRQLMAFCRKQALERRLLNLNDLIANGTEMMGDILGKTIRVALQLEQDLPSVSVDVGMVEQVLVNLAINARDAMPNGGELSMRTLLCKIDKPPVPWKAGTEPGAFEDLESTLPGGTETILVVEDEESLRRLVGNLLRRQGYDVIEASSGAEALSVWDDLDRKVDLLFADILMPGGMSGIDLAQKVHKKDPEMKIVFTSGFYHDLGEESSKFDVSVDFIPKPYQSVKLAAAIRHNLDSIRSTDN